MNKPELIRDHEGYIAKMVEGLTTYGINGRSWYECEKVLAMCNNSTKKEAIKRRMKRYPNEFVEHEGVLYISAVYTEDSVMLRYVIELNRLYFVNEEKEKGGSHDTL